jgi:hypothetical protein
MDDSHAKLEAAAHEAGHLTVMSYWNGACSAVIYKRSDGEWGGRTEGGDDAHDPISCLQQCDIAGPSGEWLHKYPNCRASDVLNAIAQGSLELNESDGEHDGDTEAAIADVLKILRAREPFFRWATDELFVREHINVWAVHTKLAELDLL